MSKINYEDLAEHVFWLFDFHNPNVQEAEDYFLSICDPRLKAFVEFAEEYIRRKGND